MRTTIEMAREAAGDDWGLFQEYMPEIHRLAELVRADERARMANPIATPAQRTWVGLTDKDIDLFINGRGDEDDEDYVEPTGDGFGLTDADLVQLVRRSEAKLKDKNL